MGDQNAGNDNEGRYGGRFHANGQTLNNIGAMPRGRGLGNAAYRTVLGRGVIFRDPDQQARNRQTGKAAEE